MSGAPPSSPPAVKLYTRCTFCSRAFRITEDQLSVREGRVRCGKCRAVFNAYDNLIRKTEKAAEKTAEKTATRATDKTRDKAAERAEPPEKTVPPTNRTKSAASEKTGERKARSADNTADKTETAKNEPAADERPATVKPAPPIQAVPPVTVTFSAANDEETLFSAADTIMEMLPPRQPHMETVDIGEKSPAAETAGTQEEDAGEKRRERRKSRRSRDDGTTAGAAATSPETKTTPESRKEKKSKNAEEFEEARRSILHALRQDKEALEIAQQMAAREQAGGESDTGTDTYANAGDESGSGGTAARRSSRLPAFLLGFASFLLILLLAGQAAYFYRGELALAAPATRPWLETACARLHCAIPLPRRSEFLDIESSDFTSDPAHREQILLNATLRNRAPFAQAWPSLEITLTDVRDYAVLRRVLSPEEYLPPQKKNAAEFAAGGEIAVELRLEVKNTELAGYRLYVFYP